MTITKKEKSEIQDDLENIKSMSNKGDLDGLMKMLSKYSAKVNEELDK